MRKVKLGGTGLIVSELGFGGIPLTRVDKKEAMELLGRALEQGINFFDTANMYGDSEEKMGQALKGRRGEVVIASKTMARDARTAAGHIELSLERLGTDYLDICQVHNIATQETLDQVLAPGGAYEAFRQAKDKGQIRHISFSSHNIDIAIKACRSGLFETVQIPFNFIEHDPAERLFPVAREMNMGIIAMKPLGGGMLERADLCFGFLRQHEDVVPIPGIQARQELDEILELYAKPASLDADQRQAMDEIKSELGNNFCHRCGYCQPCPEGVLIPRVLLFRSQSRRFPREMVLKLAREGMESARACIECGECEDKCPYGLPVPEMVAKSLEQYQAYLAAG